MGEQTWNLGGREDWLGFFEGAYVALRDQLEWTERRHENGAWHVLVSLPGFDWAGNDGHLLSEDREESRRAAFFGLLCLLGSDEELRRAIGFSADLDRFSVPSESEVL